MSRLKIEKRKRFSLVPIVPEEYATACEAYCWLVLLETRGTRKEIGNITGISHRTVETHLQMLRSKLGCKNRQELIDLGVQYNWLQYSDAIRSSIQEARSRKESRKYQKFLTKKNTLQKEQGKNNPASVTLFLKNKLRR